MPSFCHTDHDADKTLGYHSGALDHSLSDLLVSEKTFIDDIAGNAKQNWAGADPPDFGQS